MRLALIGLAAGLLAASVAMAAPEPVIFTAPAAAHFDDAIAAFEAADKATPPPKCPTLFVGASSFRRWSTLEQDFARRTALNRGFGGSTVWEVDWYFDRVVAPYRPKAIVFYAGENDLDSGRTVDQVYADFVAFMAMKHNKLGDTPVWFISAKPSKLRWHMQDKFTALNARVKTLADQRDDLAFIDIVPVMLKKDGTPKDIFVEDNLHMTAEGYKLWTPIVEKALATGQKGKAPSC
jgi:lysophospholipase L1-like esterase